MGSIRLRRRLPAMAGPDDAAEVGAWALVQQATATLVTPRDTATGPLVYGEEAPLRVGYRQCHARIGSNRNYSWFRFELRARPEGPLVRAGTCLALADHPYSNGWTHQAAFKPPCKKGATARPDSSAQTFADARDLVRWVESFPFDFWEKGRYLTAGVSEPSLPQEDLNRLRHWKDSYDVALGVCADFESFQDQLLRSDEARLMLEQTAANRIVFWMRGSGPVKLYDEVIAESNALLLLACRQALAGPLDNLKQWRDRLVTDKVRDIYCGHLNRLNKRVKRRLAADEKRRIGLSASRVVRRRQAPRGD